MGTFNTDPPKSNGDDSDNTLLYKIANGIYNLVSGAVTLVLGAGTAIIGKVGFDQSTPGTTNGVVANAGENVIGKTVGVSVVLVSTPVLSAAGAYATGDYVGTTTAPQAFAGASRVAGNAAFIKSLNITNKVATVMVAMELWVFDRTFTAPTDNAAWAITDADQLNCLGVIPIPTTKWYTNSNGQAFSDDTLALAIKPNATSLFYALVIRGSYTFTDGDLQLRLGIMQD